MNTNALERHIIDTVKEWQMKIGYRSEEMKLYYPDVSLAGLLELADGWTEASLKEALQEFSKETKERLGGVQISNVKDRYCVAVPAAGCTYIHENEPDSAFLRSFLDWSRRWRQWNSALRTRQRQEKRFMYGKIAKRKDWELYSTFALQMTRSERQRVRRLMRMCIAWRRMILVLPIIDFHGQIFRNWSVRIHR